MNKALYNCHNLVQKIEVVPIDSNNLVAIVVTNKGHVDHKNIYIPGKIDNEEVKPYKEFYLKTYYFNLSKHCENCYVDKL